MFTGLIEEVGTLVAVRGEQITVAAPALAPTLALGDSLAVQGICLTVTAIAGEQVSMDLSATTRGVTTAAGWRPGRRLNLERAVAMGDRLGGHLVSGHVDVVSKLLERTPVGSAVNLVFALSEADAALVVPKGSIAVDGTSLTVTTVEADRFGVTVIPHTGAKTTLLDLSSADAVNLEFDILAKLVQRQLAAYLTPSRAPRGLTLAKLAEHGFAP